MMTVSAVKTALSGLRKTQIDALSDAAKVPVPTIYKIRSGETVDPRASTLYALSRVIESADWARIAYQERAA